MILTENLNVLWASVLFETLYRLGLRTVVLSPGSRSGPLAIAAAAHPHLEALPILDERSAAFLPLALSNSRDDPLPLSALQVLLRPISIPRLLKQALVIYR